jgi:hypothetical protein
VKRQHTEIPKVLYFSLCEYALVDSQHCTKIDTLCRLNCNNVLPPMPNAGTTKHVNYRVVIYFHIKLIPCVPCVSSAAGGAFILLGYTSCRKIKSFHRRDAEGAERLFFSCAVRRLQIKYTQPAALGPLNPHARGGHNEG